MKQRRHITVLMALLFALGMAFPLAVPAGAAESQPVIELSETGAKNEYKITVRGVDSTYCSIQFDLEIGTTAEAKMVWADDSASTFGKVVSEQAGEKQRLTFYYDKVTSLTNSSDAVIGTLTLSGDASFSTSGKMKLVNAQFEEKVFEHASLKVSSSSGGGDSDSTGSAPTAVSWSQVKNEVKTSDNQKTLTLDLTQNPGLSAGILGKLAEEKIDAVLDFGEYQWLIDGSSIGNIPANRVYYNLSITPLDYQNVSLATNHTDIAQFEIAYDGAFPFEAVLRYPVGERYAGQTVYLARYRDDAGRLAFVSSAQVDSGGVVELPFDHASKYVLTAQNLWQESVQWKANNPETGGPPEIRVPALGSPEMDNLLEQEQNQAIAQQTQNIEMSGGVQTNPAQAVGGGAPARSQSSMLWYLMGLAAVIFAVFGLFLLKRKSKSR